MSDTPARLAYLHECVALLWPQTAGDLVVLPGRRTPRIAVPARPRRAAAAATLRYTAQQPWRDRVAAFTLAGASLAGADRLRPRVESAGAPGGNGDAESVDDLLGRVLGERVVCSLAITAARANRKPVLQVFDRRGRTVAFAKVGISPVARRLVDAEAEALAVASAALPSLVVVPTPVHHGTWGETSVLVTTPLPLGRRIRPRARRPELADAMRAVAALGSEDGLAAYLDELVEQADALAAGPWRGVLGDLRTAIRAKALRTGAWHGDWTPWNCARDRSRILLWDLERFDRPVPLGFDALHYALNEEVRERGVDFVAAAAHLHTVAPELLRPWHLDDEAAQLTCACYLYDLAMRYLADDVVRTDPMAGQPERWALPVITAALQ